MELNREQIINDLECLRNRILHSKLAEQVYEKEIMSLINAIALIKELTEQLEQEQAWANSMIDNLRDDIKELTEENARLTNLIGSECDHCACELLDQRDKANAEIERLRDLLNEAIESNADWVADNIQLRRKLKTIQTDTVRKMRDMLSNRALDKYPYVGYIDVFDMEAVAKELLEENK